MEKRKVFDQEKMYEYTEVLKAIKETVPDEELASVCLQNQTLREMAGYNGTTQEDIENQYVKDFLDKLSYEEHNKKVEAAKAKNDKAELERLSDIMMTMAGYKKEHPVQVNSYARSFVDRTLFNKQVNRINKAVKAGRLDVAKEAYETLCSMTNHSEAQPYGIVNPYAQTFVDNGYISIYTEGKILGSVQKAQPEMGIAI